MLLPLLFLTSFFAMFRNLDIGAQYAFKAVLVPLLQASASKYDQFLQLLMAPSVMSTVLAWEPHLKQVGHLTLCLDGLSWGKMTGLS